MTILYQILIAPLEAVMRVLLSALYGAIGSYGVAIFFLSLIINIVLFPLFQMAERWQEAERKVQKILKPKLQQFRQAFSGEERHAMVQSLYRQTGYHPAYAMRSSFGLFLQLPFWIAGYQLLSRYQPLNGASFLVFEDLGKPDGLLWGFNLLPFVMTALNVAGALVYTKSLSRAEQIQPLVLASLFLVLLYGAPAGLLIYWTFNSLFSFLRIALFSRTQTKGRTPAAGPTISPAQKIPSPEASSDANHGGGTEQFSSTSKPDLGTTADDSGRTGIHVKHVPLMLTVGLCSVDIATDAFAYTLVRL